MPGGGAVLQVLSNYGAIQAISQWVLLPGVHVMNTACVLFARHIEKSTIAILLLLLPLAAARAALTLEEVINPPYFRPGDIEEVRKGGVGVARLHEVSDREIAVAIACLVNSEADIALAPFLGNVLPVDSSLLRQQSRIDPDSPEASFEKISLGSDDNDEIRHYLRAEPGFGLNLSDDEIASLQALRAADDSGRVETLLENILHARYRAYRDQGLPGTPPYARGDGEHVMPGEELRKTEVHMTGLHELYPEFHDDWLVYPRKKPAGLVADDHFWIKLDIDERPAFILSHRLVSNNDDVHLVGIRDYYVSHFFDVAQRVAILVRLASGQNVLVYVERAWVDYWSGLASLSKKIGRKVMLRQMEHLLKEHGICGG